MNKYTPKSLIKLREDVLVQKWRASNRNSTIIENPTVEEIRSVASYATTISKYVNHMISSIIKKEGHLYGSVRVRFPDYYKNRYDVTPVEHTILREKIVTLTEKQIQH